MGCNSSKEVPNTIVEGEMVQVKASGAAPTAFEIPIDDIKVAANHPSSAGSKKSKQNPKKLAADLKAKEDRAEKNRQKELEKIQQSGQDRDEAIKKAQERKKVNESQKSLNE